MSSIEQYPFSLKYWYEKLDFVKYGNAKDSLLANYENKTDWVFLPEQKNLSDKI